ncbi:MAG: hypothetical protein V3V00_10745 [Saprospiraceae bacterium]
MYQNYKTLKTINPLVLILGLIFGLFFIFWFIKNIIFKILYLVAPVLFIAALIMNHKVVWGYCIWLWKSIKSNPIFGLLTTALSIVGYPFVGLYLALRAYQLRGKAFQKTDVRDGDYIKYTEMDSEDFLDISKEKTKQKQKSTDKDYEDLI